VFTNKRFSSIPECSKLHWSHLLFHQGIGLWLSHDQLCWEESHHQGIISHHHISYTMKTKTSGSHMEGSSIVYQPCTLACTGFQSCNKDISTILLRIFFTIIFFLLFFFFSSFQTLLKCSNLLWFQHFSLDIPGDLCLPWDLDLFHKKTFINQGLNLIQIPQLLPKRCCSFSS